MFKSSMSVSPYSIAQFLNFVLKNKKQSFVPLVYAMNKMDWWPCDWSQVLCGVSLGWGNESLFKLFRSHDQDGHHAHIWSKLLNIFSGNLKADDLDTWYAASHTRVLPSLFKWYPRLDLHLFNSKIRFGPVCFCIGKRLNNGFFRNYRVYYKKVGRCSQLKWVHEALWVQKVKVIHWPWSQFNILKLLFLNNRWFQHILSTQVSDIGPMVLWFPFTG